MTPTTPHLLPLNPFPPSLLSSIHLHSAPLPTMPTPRTPHPHSPSNQHPHPSPDIAPQPSSSSRPSTSATPPRRRSHLTSPSRAVLASRSEAAGYAEVVAGGRDRRGAEARTGSRSLDPRAEASFPLSQLARRSGGGCDTLFYLAVPLRPRRDTARLRNLSRVRYTVRPRRSNSLTMHGCKPHRRAAPAVS